MGSGVTVDVGTKVGKKTVGVGAGGVGTGVNVGAGLALTQDDRCSTQAIKKTAVHPNRFLRFPRLPMRLRILLPLIAGWFA